MLTRGIFPFILQYTNTRVLSFLLGKYLLYVDLMGIFREVNGKERTVNLKNELFLEIRLAKDSTQNHTPTPFVATLTQQKSLLPATADSVCSKMSYLP